MITFGGNKVKLADNRKEPTDYDWLAWDYGGLVFLSYKDHKIEVPYHVGNKYHIILYRKPIKTFKVPAFSETFDACLINPLDYAEYMAGNQYYGIIGKVSDKSKQMFLVMYDEIKMRGYPHERFRQFLAECN